MSVNFFKMNKKGVELTLNTVVVAIIVLIILVVILIIFSGMASKVYNSLSDLVNNILEFAKAVGK